MCLLEIFLSAHSGLLVATFFASTMAEQQCRTVFLAVAVVDGALEIIRVIVGRIITIEEGDLSAPPTRPSWACSLSNLDVSREVFRGAVRGGY